MPAVKVFNIFGGQKPTEKRSTSPPANSAPQKFYRTFSVAPEISTEHKGGKVTAIAAHLEKKISEPAKLSSDNVHVKNYAAKFICDSVHSAEVKPRHHAYENVQFPRTETVFSKSFNLLEESKGYSSIYENITVFGKLTESEAKVESDPNSESKLDKALESFDKILSEFTVSTSLSPEINLNVNPNFVVPKLQKSKTCSIIESRCILKKTNSDPESDRKVRNLSRKNSIDKTTSLWNLDDMKGKELTSPLKPLSLPPSDKVNSDKYATYKISSKSPSRPNCIKTEDLKKLDVKTRILKKTLSNPPSSPVPVVNKTKLSPKKSDNKKCSEVKKIKTKLGPENAKPSAESSPRSRMQKAKSVWEIGNESMKSPVLERTKSSTSIAGSPSKIPVIRSQMSQNKFSSTRALFSPTPVDLNNLDQARECVQKKKLIISRKSTEKPDLIKPIKQKSQLNLKADAKRSTDKTKKDALDKKAISSPKLSPRDYSEEINAIRAKLQQKKNNNKRDLVIGICDNKRNENETSIDSSLSPVRNIVKRLECKTASELRNEPNFVSCKVIPPEHKILCVANTTFHNHLSTLVGRQIRCVESRDDSKICSQEKLPVHKHSEEKISDTHSDCSDDSGHVSNDAVNDSDVLYDNVRELSPLEVDVADCKIFSQPKPFRSDLEDTNVCPVRPTRRARSNEVASGTHATTVEPKVEEQVRDTVNISIITNYGLSLT
ncbi:unnamed protein product [Leptosia nina]|uniref:Uncharacterized protein n=1 Tax=Leptosia nina TaxID=320188 RepID=A0AAV1IX46_9NEOP